MGYKIPYACENQRVWVERNGSKYALLGDGQNLFFYFLVSTNSVVSLTPRAVKAATKSPINSSCPSSSKIPETMIITTVKPIQKLNNALVATLFFDSGSFPNLSIFDIMSAHVLRPVHKEKPRRIRTAILIIKDANDSLISIDYILHI